ncbi:MAG: thioredoxin domain-containing protein, partial [Thermodesulfobacteriota bacterium]
KGGVYDHIGFGFHRYSTDERWFLPHFEKMLYDQALLAIAYTETYQVTKKNEYRQTAIEILSYVARDMTSPGGGFYSAEDADSEGEEGKFYVWSKQEIQKILPEEIAGHILKVFNITEDGNFTDEGTGSETGKNIIYPGRPIADMAADLQISEENLVKEIDSARMMLFDVRKKRIHPGKDDKVLTDWNGLMIAAFSKAAQVFGIPEYLDCARKAVGFIFEKLCNSEKKLFHRYRDKETSIPAFLDDYAFLIWGLIELYEASFEVSWLQRAIDLNTVLLDKFWDDRNGGFFLTANDAETVLLRMKENYDGAIPSGNSVAMLNLLRLSRMTSDPELEVKAELIGRFFSKSISEMPSAHTHMLSAVNFALGPSWETVIAGDSDGEDTKSMLHALRGQFVPNNVVIFLPTKGDPSTINQITGFTKELTAVEGKSTAYVCKNFQCSLPTTDSGKMLDLLSKPS